MSTNRYDLQATASVPGTRYGGTGIHPPVPAYQYEAVRVPVRTTRTSRANWRGETGLPMTSRDPGKGGPR